MSFGVEPMSALAVFGRVFGLSVVGTMAVGAVGIFVYNLAHPNRPKAMETESCPIILVFSAAGVLCTLFGLWFAMYYEGSRYGRWALSVAAGGFLVGVISMLLNAFMARARRRAWAVVSAHCIERQLERKLFSNDGGPSEGWVWKVVCEMDYGGKHYVVRPKAHWSDVGQGDRPFWKEEKARRFLSQRISPNGECKVRVNPANPLDAELVG